jgi:hypothetical protein
MPKFKQIAANDDGWSEYQFPLKTGYKMACCDCGLVHDAEFEIFKVLKTHPDGSFEIEKLTDKSLKVGFRMKRNNRSSAQIRRHKI